MAAVEVAGRPVEQAGDGEVIGAGEYADVTGRRTIGCTLRVGCQRVAATAAQVQRTVIVASVGGAGDYEVVTQIDGASVQEVNSAA